MIDIWLPGLSIHLPLFCMDPTALATFFLVGVTLAQAIATFFLAVVAVFQSRIDAAMRKPILTPSIETAYPYCVHIPMTYRFPESPPASDRLLLHST